MQVIAMLTMLIDHIGLVFFKNDPWWRIAGRLAFPIYAYYIVLGYQHTKSIKNYMNRLLLLTLISQIPYMLALNSAAKLNVVGTLYLCLVVLYVTDHQKRVVSVPVAVIIAAIMEFLNFDYGFYGLALVLIYRYMQNHYIVFAHLMLNLLVMLLKPGWEIQIFSIFATLAIVYGPKVYRVLERRSVPNWLWRSFYPAHLALIALFKWF
ncbi:TraX family protein [Paenibacillus beijingensis]|uniref:Conjugal transfer protein TraX n=1 Tax=Paenibacillus beijingensis TaxID=1126833 RepID=A0A0D5NJ50_9BACL|nr:TraX family protein [Paenibacillus beijingensis]AJY75110.1 hypothetical protein VN24_11640 [Paenibacillus beijingensis]